MRVLHVAEPTTGGVMELVSRLIQEQRRRDHDVHLLVPSSFPPAIGTSRHNWTVDRRRPWSVPSALRELHDLVLQVRPDVVHLHSFVAGVLGRLPLVVDLRAVPVVYQPHAWPFDLFSNPLLAGIVRGWERVASSRTSVLAVNCRDELLQGRRAGVHTRGFPLSVIVDLMHFVVPTNAERAASRAALGMRDRRVVVVVGRLGRQKGQDLLVSAWEDQPLEDTDLFLVGPGDTTSLAGLAPTQWGESIHSIGEVEDVRPWLWAADVLALPSRYEGESLAVAEALACGLPVVATAVNGAFEAVSDGPVPRGGAVVPLGDMEELLKQVRRRLDDIVLRHRESRQARQRAVAMFDARAFVDRLDAAYDAAVTVRRTRDPVA